VFVLLGTNLVDRKQRDGGFLRDGRILWHKQLSEIGEETDEGNPINWLGLFKNYKTFCPYLVGSYGRVAHELARYIAAGFRTFILDIPPDEEERVRSQKAVTHRRAQV